MSDAKFTKGPWVKVKRRYDSAFAVESDNTGFGVCTTVLNEDTDAANAHLIAAAPEMYAMLEKAMAEIDWLDEFIHSERGVGKREEPEMVAEIKKLLAKARVEI